MSDSYSFSSSTSTPAPLSPEDKVVTDILNQVANMAMGYAQQMYSWGQQVFNEVTDVTNANIAAFTRAADTAMRGADESMGAFTNSFMPDYQGLRATAADYDSTGRQARDAGAAESGMMQGMDVAKANAERTLEGQGIDTSSGRYADLELANQTKGIAAAVGAGQQAIRADEATALGLKKQALDYGIQLPGIATNFLNQANQARIASQNSEIARANAGVNLKQLPNAYLGTAMGDKFPPSRQNTQGSSQSRSSRPDQNKNNQDQSGRDRGGGMGDLMDRVGPAGRTSNAGDSINPSIRNGVFGGGAGVKVIGTDGGSNWSNAEPWNQDTSGGFGQFGALGGQPYDPMAGNYGEFNTGIGTDWGGNQVNLSGFDPSQSFFGQQNQISNMGQFNGDWGTGQVGGDNSGYTGWDGQQQDPMYNYDPGGWDSENFGDYNNQALSGDYYGDQSGYGYEDPSQSAGYDYNYQQPSAYDSYSYDWQQPSDSYNYSGDSYNAYDPGYNSYDSGGGWGSYDSGGGGGGGDYGLDYSSGDWGDYARGGQVGRRPVGRPTTGGPVPRSASPSRGRQTDDIPARLNANEFVIPRDVAQYKGKEFFHKLIATSRKNLASQGKPHQTGPIGGQPSRGPAPSGPPRFRSRPMGR